MKLAFLILCTALFPAGAQTRHVVRKPAAKAAPKKPAEPPKPPENYRVTFDTSKGPIAIEVTRAWAPQAADRFYTLVQSGYYDGARFFRVVPEFVVQFGLAADPAVTRKWDKAIPDDPVVKSNARGYVTFAMRGPDSRTTQVFFNLGDNARLDAMGFAPFGLVTSGMEIVDRINAEYGEQPRQDDIGERGNAYLEQEFPNLDYIKSAKVEKIEPPKPPAPAPSPAP